MEREIKFRAFDGKRMIFFESLMIGLEKKKKTVPYVYFTKDTFNGEVRLGKHHVMQFTGEKDIDGVDIYEEDIIKAEYGIGCVRFYSGCFFLEWIDDPEANMELLTIENFKQGRPRVQKKVIGNIHQTPNYRELYRTAPKTDIK